MSKHIEEEELRALFAEVEAPPGLDKWRERIADVHAEHDPVQDGVVTELRPRTRKKRSFAVAAAVVAVVGLGGAVVMSRLLTDAPPADPTMIIDGPDKTSSSPPPTTSKPNPSGTTTAQPPGAGQPTGGQPVPGGSVADPDSGDDQGSDPGAPGGGPEPTWGPMTGDPSITNTGVPPGTTLREHQGDLRITTAGQVVTDLRVNGTVIVEAPGVTLRRVVIVAPFGATALQQLAGDLTVVDSEFSGGESLAQRANGLVVRRSQLPSGMTLAGGVEVTDSYLTTSDVQVTAGATGILLRHNVIGRVAMSDLDGPIRNVTVQDNLLTQVNAPTEAGSASIHVLTNRFRDTAPSTGWNAAATDYRWSGNVFADTGAPADP